MNQTDLEKEISKETGIKREDVKTVVNSFISTVKRNLTRGIDVKIKGLGSWEKYKLKSRKYKSPNGEIVEKPTRYSIKHIVSKSFIKEIMKQKVYE